MKRREFMGLAAGVVGALACPKWLLAKKESTGGTVTTSFKEVSAWLVRAGFVVADSAEGTYLAFWKKRGGPKIDSKRATAWLRDHGFQVGIIRLGGEGFAELQRDISFPTKFFVVCRERNDAIFYPATDSVFLRVIKRG